MEWRVLGEQTNKQNVIFPLFGDLNKKDSEFTYKVTLSRVQIL